jgi:glycerate-2-kinase
MGIQNKKELCSHGNIHGRELAIDIMNYTLETLDPRSKINQLISIENDSILKVNNLKYKLEKIKNIYVLGAGKGSAFIADALENVLKDRITEGFIVEKRGQARNLRRIKVVEAGHPIPDIEGYQAAQSLIAIAKKASKGDLVFVCITGGASALLPMPVEGITLDEKIIINKMLLNSGANIEEINSVRKHISSIKGGRLAKYLHPAEIINLIIIDEVAGLPWGPTVPDKSTFNDAMYTLKKYDLYDKVPISIQKHIEKGIHDKSLETPKEQDFSEIKVNNVILGKSEDLVEAADIKAKALGLNSIILSSVIEGESKDVGIVLGGPNQECVLASAMAIKENNAIVITSLGSDGTDGPTDIAGGIVDSYTINRAEKLGLKIPLYLKKHNTSHVLRKLKDAIYTGPTGTNLMDLRIIIVLKQLKR